MTEPDPNSATTPLFGLVVQFGSGGPGRSGPYIPPTADYSCRCGYSDAATGAAAVQRFAATVRAAHQAVCPLRPPSPERPPDARRPPRPRHR